MNLRHRLRAMSFIGIAGIATAFMGTSVLGQNFQEGPPPKAPKNPDMVGSTLDFPTGDYQDIDLASGRGMNLAVKPKVVWEDVLRVHGVAWLRLYFSNVHLEDGSFIRVTSLHDGEVQELDSATMAMWSNSSAYFNGNALKIELVAGGLTIDNEFAIDKYAYELGVADRGDGCGICGNDDRTPSSDNSFARLFPSGCSATVYNEASCMVTAGHCLSGGGSVVQFNVPASNGDCSTNNPPVADQFPVTDEAGVNGGVGNDYGALQIGTNSSGQTPYDRYGLFVPVAASVPGSGTLSNHGYGVDSQCDRSQTQQNHSGPILYTDSTTVVYDVDMTYGNSGSSLVYDGEIVGVVTHCSYSCENYGTRIDISGFVQARAQTCSGGGDPTGACCLGTSCYQYTSGDCASAGGDYQGDGTSCAGNPCGGGGGGEGDACADAVQAVKGDNYFDTSNNSDSGYGAPDDSQCPGTYLDWDGSPDYWFFWIAPSSGTANFSTCDTSSYDTSLVIYQGSDCNNLVQVACNGDAADSSGCQPYHSEIDVSVTGGQTYYARLGGWQGGTGQGTLAISGDFGSPEYGACCYSDGSCEVQTESACVGTGGTWQGAGTNCGNVNCGGGGGGACCFGSDCEIQPDESTCAAQGGTWLGDGTTCAGNPCGGGGGGEVYLGISNIDSWDGYESGSNETRMMSIPAGSSITGVGWDNVTLSAHDPSWGSEAGIMFHWENDGVPFAGYITIFPDDGAPGDYGPATDFEDLTLDWNFTDADGDILVEFFETYDDAAGVVDGTWNGGSIYVVYDGGGGGDPTGACCVGTSCSVGTAADCSAAGGDYLGDGTGCSGNPCDQPPATGACCIAANCYDQTADDCNASGGDYYGDGSNCADVSCEEPPATGACCVGTSCFAATADDCATAGGDYQGDNTDCGSVDCGGGGGEIVVAHTIVGTGLLSIDQPNYTVDLYVTMPADHRLDAVAGTPDQQKMLTCSGSFFQSANGGPTSVDINPGFYEFDPDLEWDSRVTMGCIDTTGNPFDENNLQNIGIDWTDFENGNDLSVGNGLWFHLPTDPAGESQLFTAQDCSQQYGVLLARLTVLDDGAEVGFEGLVQGRDSADNVYQETVETHFGYTPTEDCNGNMVPDACDIANGTSEDTNGDGIPDECGCTCLGDADGDCDADVDDVLLILSAFGSTNGDGDITGDGVCNVDDILLLLSWFGSC